MRKSLVCAIALLAATACGSPSQSTTTTSSASAEPAASGPPPSPAAAVPGGSLANGRSIFQTGRDVKGVRITAQPPPLMPSCAACHRSDGSGGVHLPGGAVSADLRHKALVTNQKPPYTLPLLERAISKGLDNTGQPLNRVMPRWRMSPADLHDVAQYVLGGLK
jgi:mono/diheme cytochrome c family protein